MALIAFIVMVILAIWAREHSLIDRIGGVIIVTAVVAVVEKILFH